MGTKKKNFHISSDGKILDENVVDDIKSTLSSREAYLIWYLRNLPVGSTFSFFMIAKNLYDAYQAKSKLIELLD